MSLECIDTDTNKVAQAFSSKGRVHVLTNGIAAASLRGDAFIWSTSHVGSTGEHPIYLRNTNSAQPLVIVEINAAAGSVVDFQVNRVTGDGDGSDSFETNLNFQGGDADCVHLADNVGTLGTVSQMTCRKLSKDDQVKFSFYEALRLFDGGDAITVSIDSNNTNLCVDILGYFE